MIKKRIISNLNITFFRISIILHKLLKINIYSNQKNYMSKILEIKISISLGLTKIRSWRHHISFTQVRKDQEQAGLDLGQT